MPKVSVIVPNYNHARYLRQRVDSVLGQTYQDFEVILLDDASTDESRVILREYAKDPRVRLEINETNSGSSFKQWDKGIRLARGEYIWIAESDDSADERLLERLVKILDEEPEVVFAYCRSFWMSQDGRPKGFADTSLTTLDPLRWSADFRAEGHEECRNWLVFDNSVPNASSVVFRKAVYHRVGGVDQSMVTSGDWKLWATMALEGKIAYVSEPLSYYREHEATVRAAIHRSGRGAAEQLRMVRWMLDRVTPPEALLDRAYDWAGQAWVYAVLNRRLPSSVRWPLLREALATDPHPLRHLVHGMLITLRLKTKKELRVMRERFARRAAAS